MMMLRIFRRSLTVLLMAVTVAVGAGGCIAVPVGPPVVVAPRPPVVIAPAPGYHYRRSYGHGHYGRYRR